MSWLLALVVVVPLLAAAAAAASNRPMRGLLVPLCTLPALAVAIAPPAEPLELSWLVLGTTLEADAFARPVLALLAVLWTAAGFAARTEIERRGREFAVCWCLSAAGMLLVPLAGDLVGFYLGFSLMTFAAYGLVVHARGGEAMRAGRIYMVMAVLGEAALLAGVVLAAQGTGTIELAGVQAGLADAAAREAIALLLVVGLGTKAGLLGLHMWLPLAHPVAPAPASAVLSGAMVNAGLIGWLRILPGGAAAEEGLGALLAVLGLAGAVLAALAGLAQRDLKTALAYSTVSQIGVITALVGAGLAVPSAWPVAVSAALFYLVHHGLAKGALFLAAGLAGRGGVGARRLVLLCAAAASLALAAAPASAGAIAKESVGGALAAAPAGWGEPLGWVLDLSAVTTALLLGWALLLLARTPSPGGDEGQDAAASASLLALGALTAAAIGVAAWLPALSGLQLPAPVELSAAKLIDGLWPLLAAAAVGAALLRHGRRVSLPPGDLIVPCEAAARALAATGRRLAAAERRRREPLRARFVALRAGASGLATRALRGELRLRRFAGGALALLLVVLALIASFA